MSSEPSMLVQFDAAMPTPRQKNWIQKLSGSQASFLPDQKQDLQQALMGATENTPAALPPVGVMLAERWSDAFVQQACRTARELASPVVVGVCEPASGASAKQLISAGVWNVLCADAMDPLCDSLTDCVDRLQAVEWELASPAVQKHLVGSSRHWRAFLRELIWASKYSSAAMFLHGETGTGKELLARLIHTMDDREEKKDLVVVDCTTLSSELAASELFGHEKGAFTGAVSNRTGAVQLADGGTLFLDEVGELPLPVQAQLLRVLQEGTYKTVGGNGWKRSRFRLVCATHRDLESAVEAGTFRQDLFFRISGWTANVPALRKRATDIPEIANHFLREFGCEAGVDSSVACVLERYPFKGNVRELRQLMMQSAVKHCGNSAISLGDLPSWWHRCHSDADSVSDSEKEARDSTHDAAGTSKDTSAIAEWVREGIGLREITQRAGDMAVQEALALEGQQVGRAARRLGITERAIQLRRAQRPDGAAVG